MSEYVDAFLGEADPEKDLPYWVEAEPHRQLLFVLVRGALQSEAEIMQRKQRNKVVRYEDRKSTDYYAGRRAGFVSAAAQLMATLYGGKYESAKHEIMKGVKAVSEITDNPQDILDGQEDMALAITEQALLVV